VVSHQENNGADYSHQQAVQIQSRNSGGAEGVKEPTANEGADDPQKDVKHHALALSVNNLAPDETREQTKYNPRQKGHFVQLSAIGK
jgi:hypothetical protein